MSRQRNRRTPAAMVAVVLAILIGGPLSGCKERGDPAVESAAPQDVKAQMQKGQGGKLSGMGSGTPQVPPGQSAPGPGQMQPGSQKPGGSGPPGG